MKRISPWSALPFVLLSVSTAMGNTLSLGDLVQRAIVNASTVERAKADLERSQTRADSAYTVFAPYVSVVGQYARLSEEELPEVAPGFSFPQFLDTYSLQVSAQFALSDYLLTRPALYNIGAQGVALEQAKLFAAKERVAMQALTLALRWIAASQAVDVARAGAETLMKGVQDIKRLQAAGAATRSDALSIEAQHAALTTSVIRTRGLVKTIELQLGQLIGHPSGTPLPKLDIDLDQPRAFTRLTLEAALEAAVQQRPELESLRQARALQGYDVDRYFGELFPKLALVGVVDTANPNQRIFPLVEEFNTTWALQLTLSWSQNDFVIQRSLYREAQQALKGVDADLRGLKQAVELELASALAALETATELAQASRSQLKAAEAALDDQKRLFEAGETTSLQLLEREQAHREAALNRIDAHVQLKLAEIRYQKGLGGLNAFALKEFQ